MDFSTVHITERPKRIIVLNRNLDMFIPKTLAKLIFDAEL